MSLSAVDIYVNTHMLITYLSMFIHYESFMFTRPFDTNVDVTICTDVDSMFIESCSAKNSSVNVNVNVISISISAECKPS